jgi:acyl-homoserine lactone acylase PvdQ
LAPARALLIAWDFRATNDSRAAALALLLYKPIRRAKRLGRPALDPVAAARGPAKTLQQGFGRIDPPLGDALRLRRGGVDLPLDGGPDLLRAIGWTLDPDRRMRADFGDGLIMRADWARDGSVATRSIHQFGAATARPQSPHYADQAKLFAQHAFRPPAKSF